MGEDAGETYQSLYRRYRPQRFEDVRGQEHVTTALRNAVRQGKVAHAYLFSGPRGTGKTSTARILAMALDCEHPVDGEPDGTCGSCVEIRRGSSLDVQELDAASNRRLEEMRDLLSRVSLGTRGRWKVYIIDEVHQLTSDAASALLKTLEEPPAHVVFVLATTDPQKVLPTIRSRTQHFEFRLLSSDVLGGLLADVNERAGLGVAPEALDLVVRRGHGSARDALSVLDQVAAAGEVEDEASVVSDVVDALADRDAGRVLVAIAEGMASGREPRRLATDLLDHLRNGFLALTARGLVQLPDDAAAVAEGQARRLGLAGVVRALEVIGLAAADMRDSVDPRVTLEVALMRVASPAADADPAALLARIERLEAQVAGGTPITPRGGPAAGGAGPVTAGPGARQQDPEAPPARGVSAETVLRPPSSAQTPPPHVASTPDTSPPPDRAATPDVSQTLGGTPTAGAGGSADTSGPATEGPRSRPPRSDRAVPRRDESRPSLGAPPPLPRPGPGAPAGGRPAPSGPPAGGRPTIGAHRRGGPDAPTGPGRPGPGAPDEATGESRPRPGRPDEGTSQAGPGPGRPVPPQSSPAGAPQGPPTAAPQSHPTGTPQGPPAATPPPSPAAPPGTAGPAGPPPRTVDARPTLPGALPSRDELTKAWGDTVLPGLPARVKAYLAQGRFVAVDDAAVFALPDQGLLGRAASVKQDAEAALAGYFDRLVPLRLVLDDGAAPARSDVPPPEDDDPSSYDFDDLEDAGAAVVSPEQRLLEAFPGAEEVAP